jgi:phage gpG-like protein
MSTVTGQGSVVRMLAAVGDGSRAKLVDTMKVVSFDIQQHVQREKLSGQVLNRRTGILRNSISERVQESTDAISAVVGTNVKYAAAHEYGIQRNVVVSAHYRMQTMAFGKPMKNPREVLVNQHSGYLNLPERSFLRSSLRDKAPQEIERIRVSMAELIAQAQA